MIACAVGEPVRSIAGGFLSINVSALMAAWRACRSKPLGTGDFRAWLACHEAVARRCAVDRGRVPVYGHAELAGLLGVAEKRARGSIRRLVAAGQLAWSNEAIAFPEAGDPIDLDAIGRGKGSVAIPRRLLRFLAKGASRAMIATALGVLLRCLSRRKAGWDGRGRVKASWVARTFGVDHRRVVAARKELVALGWIEHEASDQRAENRWGRCYRIDLAWDRSPASGPSLPPPPALDRPEIATPSVDPEPLSEREENQEPAARGPTGVEASEQGEGSPRPGTSSPASQPTHSPNGPPAGPPDPATFILPHGLKAAPPAIAGAKLPPPWLGDIRPEDLENTGRLLELHGQCVAKGLAGPSEADRLGVVALAEHAKAIGKANPPGLFAHLLRHGCWRYITGADEDRANARIKAFQRGPGPPPMASAAPRRGPTLSEDARAVAEIGRALRAKGHRGDPFALVHRHDPGWTRTRWLAALAELDAGRCDGLAESHGPRGI